MVVHRIPRNHLRSFGRMPDLHGPNLRAAGGAILHRNREIPRPQRGHGISLGAEPRPVYSIVPVVGALDATAAAADAELAP